MLRRGLQVDVKAHLKTLVEAHAPSGHEGPIRALIREAWRDKVDEFQQDKLGSLVGIKRATTPPADGTRRKIMLAAHMDEIGMLVRDIVDGFVYVARISGVDARVMTAQTVMVHGKRPLPGVVASLPAHLHKGDVTRYPAFDDLIIDVGLLPDEVNALVQIGDLVTVDAPLLELMGRRVAAKALDDRASVAAVTVCLDALQGMSHTWDVYAAATVQEETGLFGAMTAANMIAPDVAIALDVGFGRQPGMDNDETFELGGGPSLGLGPNFHEKLNEKIRETARYHEIKIHDEPMPAQSGTDAWAIQVALQGIPTALFSLPIRNMHSAVETIDLADIERTGRLLAHFIASLDADFLKTIDFKQPDAAQG
jgi:endoglucanase